MRLDRRNFCSNAAQMGASLLLRRGIAAQPMPGVAQAATHLNVAAIDRDRILAAANAALKIVLQPLTSLDKPPAPATPHDYYTLEQSDAASDARRDALLQLTIAVPALAAGAALLRSGNSAQSDRYAEHARKHLHAWFVDPATRMNPTLADARLLPAKTPNGPATANPEGIVEAMGLAEVAQGIPFLGLDPAAMQSIKAWFATYLDWLTTSRLAGLARDRKDHHGSSWLIQAAAAAKFIGNDVTLNECRHRYKTVTIRAQIDETGMFSHELISTAAFRDCLTNLDLLAGVCELLSTRFDSVWTYELADGPGMRTAVARFFPYIEDPAKWPYPADLEDFKELPGRRPALLFAARAFARPEYATLWKTMEEASVPDSTVPEIVRSFPIRQPLLWLEHPNSEPRR